MRNLVRFFINCKNIEIGPRPDSQITTSTVRYFLTTAGTYNGCKSLRILYFGSDTFSIGPLKTLVSRMRRKQLEKEMIEDIHIVTSEAPLIAEKKKKMKFNEFIDYVKKENLPLHSWDRDLTRELSNFDFGVVASFGHLIPRTVIQGFKRGIINAHPSLLPKWRGAAPIIHTILNGDLETGVTIIDLSIGRFDKGRIFDQKKLKVDQSWTSEVLTQELGKLAGNMVLDILDDYENYKRSATPQSEEGASYAPKISTDLSYIKWEEHGCSHIDRTHKAIGKKIGMHSFFNGKLVKFVDVKVIENENFANIDQNHTSLEAGECWFDKKSKKIYIKCTDGLLEVLTLQIQYKKPVKSVDFYNAYLVDRQRKGMINNRFSSYLN